jgi:hypothetical protein
MEPLEETPTAEFTAWSYGSAQALQGATWTLMATLAPLSWR